MAIEKRTIEVQEQDIEKAVESGLKKLGLKRTDVIVEVLDEGSRGLLGLGSRNAIVRITEITGRVVPDKEPPPPKPSPKLEPKPPVSKVPEPKKEAVVSAPPPTPEKPKPAPVQVVKPAKKQTEPKPARSAPVEEQNLEELEAEKEMAVSVIQEMMQKMQMQTAVSAYLTEPDDMTGKRMAVISIDGDDLGALIGPRGETLNALQYITRLMVGHQIHRRANFAIDIGGYRNRREQALRRLADRMANKAIKRGSPVGLEPMSPYERRIIHMTLREHDNVYTQSVGEGDRRKVRILPK